MTTLALFSESQVLPAADWIDPCSTETALRFTGEPSYANWEVAFSHLDRAHKAYRWWIGDLLVGGHTWFGEGASQIYDPADDDHTSQYPSYRHVAAMFPEPARKLPLSWSHYKVASDFTLFPTLEKRMAFLMEAHAHGWTVREMGTERQRLKDVLELEVARQNPRLPGSEEYGDNLSDRLEAFKSAVLEKERESGLQGFVDKVTCSVEIDLTAAQAKNIAETAKAMGIRPAEVVLAAVSGALMQLDQVEWDSLSQMVLIEKRMGKNVTNAEIVKRLIRDEEERLVTLGAMLPLIGATNVRV